MQRYTVNFFIQLIHQLSEGVDNSVYEFRREAVSSHNHDGTSLTITNYDTEFGLINNPMYSASQVHLFFHVCCLSFPRPLPFYTSILPHFPSNLKPKKHKFINIQENWEIQGRDVGKLRNPRMGRRKTWNFIKANGFQNSKFSYVPFLDFQVFLRPISGFLYYLILSS